MKRKSVAGTWILVLAGLLCGCSGGGDPVETYTNVTHGFSIVFPEGWEVTEPGGGDMPVAAASLIPEDDPGIMLAYVTVEIDDIGDEVSLEEYAGNIRRDQSADAKYFSEHEYGEIKIGGKKARYLFFDVDWEDTTLRLLGYILVEDGKGYLITCGAIPDEFQQYHDLFRQTARTFKLK